MSTEKKQTKVSGRKSAVNTVVICFALLLIAGCKLEMKKKIPQNKCNQMKPIITEWTPKKLIEMGFTEHKSDDTRGVWWTKGNKDFEIMVSPWVDVKLMRKFEDSLPTDYIEITVNDMRDLENLISFIEAE